MISTIYMTLRDPLEQFDVVDVIASIRNTDLIDLIIYISILTGIYWFSSHNRFILLKAYNILFSTLVSQILSIAESIARTNISIKQNVFWISWVSLFLFILTANLVGMIPFSYTITSLFVLTFFLALSYFIFINIVGYFVHGLYLFGMFMPAGTPTVIIPLLVIIEVVSYCSRIFSLSIRLFANLLSGHALLKILIGFVWVMIFKCSVWWFVSLIPWTIVTIVIALELLVACLQAYVFIILLSIYVNDVINLH